MTIMNKELIFSLFREHVRYNLGIKRTKKEQVICELALKRFERGCVSLYDCYKNPPQAKIRAYNECEIKYLYHECVQVMSSVLGYNCNTFSWVGLWVDFSPSIDGYVTIYLKYDTAWDSKLIAVCSIKYEYVK